MLERLDRSFPLFCGACDERLVVVSNRPCPVGCARCGADISSYNMVDAGRAGILCVRCVLVSPDLGMSHPVLVPTPVTLNLSRASAHQVSLRASLDDLLCAGRCGCRVSWELMRRHDLGPSCFACSALEVAGFDLTRVAVWLLRLMYSAMRMGRRHYASRLEGHC